MALIVASRLKNGNMNDNGTGSGRSNTEKPGAGKPEPGELYAKRQVTDRSYNIITISMGHSNSYLIVSEHRGILVDTGCPDNIQKLQNVLERNHLNFPDIVLVVLTHTHYDHVGCLAELKEKSGAKILIHAMEKECLEKGATPFPGGTLWFSKIIARIGITFMPSKSKYRSVSPDIVVRNGYDLGSYIPHAKIIPTPGHTAGSVSLLIGNEVAFVGDTLFNVIPGTVFPPFADDVPELLKSWETLIDSGCRTFYPGHGRPIVLKKLKDSYGKRIKKIKRRSLFF